MGVLLAQELVRVRGEIDDDQPAGRAQQLRGLADRQPRLVEIVEDLVHGDEVEGVALDRRRVEVALAHLRMGDAGLVEIGPRHRQHLARQVDADAAPVERREQLQQAAGSGAEVEHGRMRASDVVRAIVQFLSSPGRWFSWQGGVATFVILLLFSGFVWSIRRLHALWDRYGMRSQRRRQRALVEFYERFERVCAVHGFVRTPTETPQEFAASIDTALQNSPQHSELDRLAASFSRAFYRVRYGNEILSHGELAELERRLEKLEESLAARDVDGTSDEGQPVHAPA